MRQWTKTAGKVLILLISLSVALSFPVMIFQQLLFYIPYGLSRTVPGSEADSRLALVQTAGAWLGTLEGTQEHRMIIDGYNAHEPLAQGYVVTYTDNWCATFVSFCAIRAGLTDIIPTECGCERQIGLWQELDRWQEEDTYLPLTGDIIYYDWEPKTRGNSTGWSDHVGIVEGTWGPFIKVIEGNKDDSVSIRILHRWDIRIRGYGLPDYKKFSLWSNSTG